MGKVGFKMRAGLTTSHSKNPFLWGKHLLAKKIGGSINPQNVIAVTGSHQVDLTCFYITSILSSKFKTKTTASEKDSFKGLLDSLGKVRPNIEKLVIDLKLINTGDFNKYLEIIRPGFLVIPELYDAKEYFLDLKSEINNLIKQNVPSEWIILNFDDEEIKKLSEGSNTQIFPIGTNKNFLVWADNIRLENFSTVFSLNYGVERVEVKLKAPGKHFVYPALSAAAVGIIHELSLISIKKGLESVPNLGSNLELREGMKGWWVLDDCFDNDPISLFWGLKVLEDFDGKRKILILGEMKGNPFNNEQVASEIIKIKPDLILLSPKNTDGFASELVKLGLSAERIYKNQTNTEIVNKIFTYAANGDVVLIKGDKHLRFDEVIERITKPLKL